MRELNTNISANMRDFPTLEMFGEDISEIANNGMYNTKQVYYIDWHRYRIMITNNTHISRFGWKIRGHYGASIPFIESKTIFIDAEDAYNDMIEYLDRYICDNNIVID